MGRVPVGLDCGSPHLAAGQGTDVVDLTSNPLARHSSQDCEKWPWRPQLFASDLSIATLLSQEVTCAKTEDRYCIR